VEDKYLGLFLLLCSREVSLSLSDPVCLEPVGLYVLFSFAKAETPDKVIFMQLYEADASVQVSPLVSHEFSETLSGI